MIVMGILEIHFHDSEFVFRPSMSIGPEGADVDDLDGGADMAADVESEGDELVFPNDAPDAGSKRGLLAGLALLVIAVVAIRAFRGGNEG
jgi:hypothetical protein